MDKKNNTSEILLLILLLSLTLFLRLAYLGDGYNKDESAIYHVSKDLAEGRYLQIMSWPYYSISIHAPAALLMKIFGPMPFIQRLLPAILGTGSIFVMYLLVKSLYGMPVAFISSFLFSISLWHLSVTRQGVSWTDPFFVLCCIYFFRRGLLENKKPFFALSGVLLAFGAHNRMYMLSGLFIVGLYSLFTRGFRKSILPVFIAGISALIVMSPIFLWNFATGLGIFSAFEKAVTTGQGFLHVEAPTSPFMMVPRKFIEFINAANLTLTSKLAGVERSSLLSMPLLDIMFDVYMVILFRRAFRERKEQDILMASWFLVAAFIFTFVITWKEEFFTGYTDIRPTRYLGILHPMPFIAAVLGFADLWKCLKKRAPAFDAPATKNVLAVIVTVFLVVLHVKIYMSVGPKTMNNLEAKNFITQDTGGKPAYVLTNFPLGSMASVKNLTYPLNIAEYRKMYPDLIKGVPSLYDPKYLTYIFPTFFYVMAPEVVLMDYDGVRSLMSLTDLPIMNVNKIKKFSQPLFKNSKNVYNVYYVVWEEKSGDGLRGILGIDDQPLVMSDVRATFKKRNPAAKPVKTLSYNGKEDFHVYKFTSESSSRMYEDVTFDFGARDNAEGENEIKVSRGNVYMPWAGFGWRHPYFQEVRYDDKRDGILPALKNTFFADVEPGTYVVTFKLHTFCAPTTDIYVNGRKLMDKAYTAKNCLTENEKIREMKLSFEADSMQLDTEKTGVERLVFEFAPDIYTMAFDMRASMPLEGNFWSLDKLEIKKIGGRGN